MNLPTLLILLFLALALILALHRMRRDAKHGKGCSCGCGGCAADGICGKAVSTRKRSASGTRKGSSPYAS
ncbi:MAG: FeoB-associated Cys-rich membrane protein [Bacteroidales bacterium]|nr:FeoB-associated Cys-rich membrane protein [Bacteroidales bacterium]